MAIKMVEMVVCKTSTGVVVYHERCVTN